MAGDGGGAAPAPMAPPRDIWKQMKRKGCDNAASD